MPDVLTRTSLNDTRFAELIADPAEAIDPVAAAAEAELAELARPATIVDLSRLRDQAQRVLPSVLWLDKAGSGHVGVLHYTDKRGPYYLVISAAGHVDAMTYREALPLHADAAAELLRRLDPKYVPLLRTTRLPPGARPADLDALYVLAAGLPGCTNVAPLSEDLLKIEIEVGPSTARLGLPQVPTAPQATTAQTACCHSFTINRRGFICLDGSPETSCRHARFAEQAALAEDLIVRLREVDPGGSRDAPAVLRPGAGMSRPVGEQDERLAHHAGLDDAEATQAAESRRLRTAELRRLVGPVDSDEAWQQTLVQLPASLLATLGFALQGVAFAGWRLFDNLAGTSPRDVDWRTLADRP
jgi:hypothetical protein